MRRPFLHKLYSSIMKKNLFFISCIIGSQSLIAAPITPDEALARLDDGAVPARVRAASDELRLARTVKTASGNPAVYVFTRQSGRTLFVSADDLARPLLGFTDSAPCGKLPPQLEWWLSEYARDNLPRRARRWQCGREESGSLIPHLTLRTLSPRLRQPQAG